MRKADMIIDMQYGSTGKGLLAGHLGKEGAYDTFVGANMPNAGHTYVMENDTKIVHKCLPSGFIDSPRASKILLGPGSVFSVDRLHDEVLNMLQHKDNFMVYVHPNAVVLKPEHKEMESGKLKDIGSTQQGSSAAMIEKMYREVHNPILASHFSDVIDGYRTKVVTHNKYIDLLEDSTRILLECSQGYSLGINTEFYPYVTSRDCSPGRFLSDMGVPHWMLGEIFGCLRTYPIRVGGTSGRCYPDQLELSWDNFDGIEPEVTTVTNRVRRVFTFSWQQFHEAVWVCRPNYVFLNFANYMDSAELAELGDGIERHVPIKWVGFGAKSSEIEMSM